MKHFLNATIVLVFSFVLGGCGENQQTTTTIYQAQVSTKILGAEEKIFTNNVDIGPKDKLQSLKIIWTSFFNNEGCWKVADVKIDRTGGNEDVVVSIAKPELVSACALDIEPTDDKRFDTVSMEASYKYGLFGSSGEEVLFIRGDGKPMVTK